MRPILIGFAAAAAVGLALCAPTVSVAGDHGYGVGGYDFGYAEYVRRDGNVSYNAYNSYDGYARGRLGYWERPGDRYYGYGRGYRYDRDRDDCRHEDRHDERRRCDDGDGDDALIPGYGYSADAVRHDGRGRREHRRNERHDRETYTDGEGRYR